MKIWTSVFIISITIALIPFSSLAQNDFNAWKMQQLNEFSDYKTKQDKEFAGFLKATWVELDTLKGKPLLEKRKIITPPKAPKTELKKSSAKKPILVKLPPQKPIPKPSPKPQQIINQPVKGHIIEVNNFGIPLIFPYDKKIRQPLRGRINKDTISQQWSLLAKSEYEPLLKQLQSSKQQLKLNDWAYAVLINKVAEKLYPERKNEQALFSWFVLIKSGYKARIAFKNRRIYLLLASQQKIYSTTYLTYDKTKYYALDFDGGKQPRLHKVFTYDANYKGSDQALDMQLPQLMATGLSEQKRDLEFKYANKQYKINSNTNKYLIDFMSTYPQVHWGVFFNSQLNNSTRQQIIEQFRPLVKGLTEQEALNLLLRFVQTSLTYATDDKQFGYENPLFAEETLFYPASDCEDRAILFAWLVQELLALDVVGLHYPGHIATAVKLNMPIDGDSITYQGNKYLIADPTYINANIGTTMPQHKNSKVEFVEIARRNL